MTERAYYSDRIETFLEQSTESVLGLLVQKSGFTIEQTQAQAWIVQIDLLQTALQGFRARGKVYFEYAVPRLGKRIDVLAVIDHVIFVLEFKAGETEFTAAAIDQVFDYALDLKNFHETTHDKPVVPILVATGAGSSKLLLEVTNHGDKLVKPLKSTPGNLRTAIEHSLSFFGGPVIDPQKWESGRYCPTPTIIEAAIALYSGHSVAEISRSDASAINLSRTSEAISGVIGDARQQSRKSICFVTGVPGAGKTLVGLNIATKHLDKKSDLHSVFLSGNGPLVAILRESFARDKVRRAGEAKQPITKAAATREVKAFVQNVHHFRDDCLQHPGPPVEHVAIFDEAQRAWNLEQTAKFMRQKKGHPDFSMSEPEFLISCLDRHRDWATIVCLVGGGQEINTGEAGISEWVDSLLRQYPEWRVHISSRLHDSEYAAGSAIEALAGRRNVEFSDDLHLGVSLRSFRTEHVSALVKQLLDLDEANARDTLAKIKERFPIVLTRDLNQAKAWLRSHARGSERYGIVVSSQAQRLKPDAIDVRSPMDPVHWFLDGKDDVRSSYYLEDVATEFHIQGLELDWTCLVWDGDFRHTGSEWQHFSFVGSRWNRVIKHERQTYLKNAYRVLLTRARQGMVIVVPTGSRQDPTRSPAYYDSTFSYLREIGFETI